MTTLSKARRRDFSRVPFFAGLLLALAAGLLPAGEEPRVMLEAALYPAPEVGSTWTLTVLVDHANPSLVSVAEPPFPEGLALEQVTQGPRLVSMGAWLAGPGHPVTYERWTAVEYRFLLTAGGRLAFDSFVVSTPQGQARTQPFAFDVRDPRIAAGARLLAAEWVGAPESLVAGEAVVFDLRVFEWDGAGERAPFPALALSAGALMPAVPPGHMLESLPVPPEDAALGTALRLRLVPLEAGEFALDERVVSAGAGPAFPGGAAFAMPALRVPVRARAVEDQGAREPSPDLRVPEAPLPPAPPFPSRDAAQAANARLFERRRGEFEAVYAAALDLWESGLRADALAALRRGERDLRSGALLAAVRREAEASIGLFGTRDERIWLFGGRFSLPALPAFLSRGSRRAVLRETAVRRVPDYSGEEIARLPEGQSARLGRESAAGALSGGSRWALVVADDGTSGWIPEENIILY